MGEGNAESGAEPLHDHIEFALRAMNSLIWAIFGPPKKLRSLDGRRPQQVFADELFELRDLPERKDLVHRTARVASIPRGSVWNDQRYLSIIGHTTWRRYPATPGGSRHRPRHGPRGDRIAIRPAERNLRALRAAGVEPGAPLLYDRVVEAVLRRPGHLLADDSTRKIALRRAADFLSDDLRGRNKKAVQYGSYVVQELDRLTWQNSFNAGWMTT